MKETLKSFILVNNYNQTVQLDHTIAYENPQIENPHIENPQIFANPLKIPKEGIENPPKYKV